MHHIMHRIGIKASTDQVYKALTSLEGLSGWWTREVQGDDNLGGQLEFIFRSDDGEIMGQMLMQVKTLAPNQTIQWRCVGGPEEWIDTIISFELSEENDQTTLIFSHKNWAETSEFSAHCSMKWATFLLSLRQYVETGKGKSAPNDLKIDNWN